MPAHALLVTGPIGAGKGAVLDHLATELLEAQAADNPSILRIVPEPDKKDIGIDAVRQIQHFTSLKSAQNDENIHRVIHIEDAHRLTGDAQNALLKIIEEPPADTVLLLSAVTARQLLPTVVSRVQELPVTIPAAAELQAYLSKKYQTPTEIARAVTMSSGLPGLALALLDQANEHPMLQAAETARKLLAASRFERLMLIDSLSKQREHAIDTCDMLGRMASVMLRKPELTAPQQQQQWHNILRQSTDAAENLRAYGQPKLTLSSLSLHL
jgi:DNA polymerase III gamma/tau subunit